MTWEEQLPDAQHIQWAGVSLLALAIFAWLLRGDHYFEADHRWREPISKGIPEA